MQPTKIARPVSISLSHSLIHAITELERETNLSLTVDWDELEKCHVAKNTFTKMLLRDIPCSRVIELLLYSVGEDGLVSALDMSGGLFITSRQKAANLILEDSHRWSLLHTGSQKTRDTDNHVLVTAESLKENISWKLDGDRLWIVLDYIGNSAWINIFVDWKKLYRYGIKPDTPVWGAGAPRSASEVLDYVLNYLHEELAWRVDEFGIVIISTRDGLEKLVPDTVEHRGEDSETLDADPPAEPGAEGR